MRKLALICATALCLCLQAAAQGNDSAKDASQAIAEFLQTHYDVHFKEVNDFQVFTHAADKYAALQADLLRARHSIHFDYFNMRDDSISRVVFDILQQKATEGVEVRVIIDAFGNGKSPQALHLADMRRLQRSGVDVRIYDRMHFPWFNHLMHRDHRKIIVIDGSVGYIGGMNIADYYIHGKKEITEWRDLHLRFTGPAVSELQRTFINFWNAQTNEGVHGTQYYQPAFESTTGSPSLSTSPADSASRHSAMAGVINRTPSRANDWPVRNNRIARDAARQAIDAARSHIQIVNPYFAPSPMIRRALKRALRRGVRVELMISAQSDVRLTPRAVEHCAYTLMKHGAEVYVYEPGFHHSKVMTIDDTTAYVGSVNLDHRSLYSDFECNLMVIDPSLTASLQAVFNADKAHSFQLTPETRKTRYSRGRRIRGRLATIFRPLL